MRPEPRRGIFQKLAYSRRILPAFVWQRLTRRVPSGRVHLIIALADHFEPAIVPGDGRARAPFGEQERRVEQWCDQYPRAVDAYRDNEGRPFAHTYFYPAEQYDRGLVDRLAEHCHAGWGEIEIHLHHGIPSPDTAANLRETLVRFRDVLACDHGCLSCVDADVSPRFAFVHGNFALANSANGFGCGVDEEVQVLADAGCYADLTFPTNPFHPSQPGKINSLYECGTPLSDRAAYRSGRDLARGQSPKNFPLMIQGPLMPYLSGSGKRFVRIDNASLTAANPPSLNRLQLWRRAAISVQGRPDWLFLKLHCHSMDPTQEDSVLGSAFVNFLRSLVTGAGERGEVLHFVSAREMVNVILAACDGKEGDPGSYRDYRFKPWKSAHSTATTLVSQTAERR